MLVTAFLTLLYWLVSAFFAMLPGGGVFPISFHNAFDWFASGFASLDFIFPVTELIVVLPIAIGFFIVRSSFTFIVWIIGVIRGSGTTMK